MLTGLYITLRFGHFISLMLAFGCVLYGAWWAPVPLRRVLMLRFYPLLRPLLLIGAIPSSLKDDTKINLLVEATKSWVKMPMRHYDLASIYPDDEARTPNTRTDITSSGPMAAVIGFQSPYNDQRSVVALLADSPRGNELLTNALNDSGKRAAMFGSVAVIRESGVNSLRVGDIYYVGHLPWFERIWFALSNHPILLAIFAAISIVLLAWVLWRMLRIISRRRLSLDDE